MDNAAKALIIGGSVLIAIGVISVALYIYSSAKNYASATEQAMTVNQINGFNRFYNAFGQNQKVRGVDAVNILNRAIEDDVKTTETSASITKLGTEEYYSLQDPVLYLNENFNFSYRTGVNGQVEEVIITGN